MTRLEAAIAGLRDLYPSAEVSLVRRRGRGGPADLRVLPSRRHPRLLVPGDRPTAARAAVLRHSAQDSVAKSIIRRVAGRAAEPVSVGLVSGDVVEVSGHLEDSVSALVAAALGLGPPQARDGVRISTAPGAVRANAKPVIAVHDARGDVVAYAKLGTTPLSARLVDAEARALDALLGSGLRSLSVPRRLMSTSWRSGPLLVQTALEGARRGPSQAGTWTSDAPVVKAMAEVAATSGLTEPDAETSPWLVSVATRAAESATEAAGLLRDATHGWATSHPRAVAHGRWHGDWGPWNMAWREGAPVVWDWERSDDSVPVGMDAVHHVTYKALLRGDDREVAQTLAGSAPAAVTAVLEAAALPHGSDVVAAVIDAYLLEVGGRFVLDAEEQYLPALSKLGLRYLRLLTRRLRGRPGTALPTAAVHVPRARGTR